MKHEVIHREDGTEQSDAAVRRMFDAAAHPNRAARRATANFGLGLEYGRRQTAIAAKMMGGFAIEGLVPRSASTVWFGESGIGKTMLALWKALCFAARGPNRPTHWCGQLIKRRGIVIFYSGEDELADGLQRLHDIAFMLMGLRGDELADTVARVLFVNPAALPDEDFVGEDASLFEKHEGKWRASGNAEGIRATIVSINQDATQPEERVIGVFQDSATSVSGFDAMEGEAVSRSFFWINRLCAEHDLFWVILGHIAQEAKLDPEKPEFRARYRLRGVVVWVTAPRLVVEVRVPSALRKNGENGKGWTECMEAIERGIATKPEDLLTVIVVKANVKDYCRRKIWLGWSEKTILADATDAMAGVARSKAQYDEMRKREKIEMVAGGHVAPEQDFGDAAQAILAIVRSIHALTGKPVTRTAIEAERKRWAKDQEMIEKHAILTAKPADGGIEANQAGPSSSTKLAEALVRSNELAEVKGGFLPFEAFDGEVSAAEPEQEVDNTKLLGAILAIAKSMATSEPGVPITGKAIVARALASRWTEQFEVLAGLDAKTWKSAERGEWALGELVNSEHLRREVEGHYTVVGVEPAKVEAANDAAEAAPDHEPVFEAIRQVIAGIVDRFVAGGGSEGDATPPDAKHIQMALLSTFVQRNHPVLLAAYEDGRLVRNVVGSKKPAYQSADWYCVEMTKPARDALRRDAEGNYWISETVDEEKAA